MSRIEQGIPSEVDLSIDPSVIEQAKSLLGPQIDSNLSRDWLQSQEKQTREKRLARFFLFCTSPFLALSCLGVLAADGPPIIHKYAVGLPGPNETIINRTTISKIRSLRRGAHLEETGHFTTTVFRGGRKKAVEFVDPRVHSIVGKALRKTGLDEMAQLVDIIQGRMALIGPRGYTDKEIVDLNTLLDSPLIPEDLKYYRQTMATVHPLPGLAGLYAATLKKDLTAPERLWLDLLYCQGASPEGDKRIFLASFLTTLRMTGSR